MPSTLASPRVAAVLDRLFADAEKTDAPLQEIAQARTGGNSLATPPPDSTLHELMSRSYMAVEREAGQFLYALVLSQGSRTVIEFGTSFGISTIYLAAALRDRGAGRLITTELHSPKAATARQNLAEAGLLDLVEVREGDALETLRDLPGPIGLLFLDGWKDLYLPLLKRLEPKLRPGSVVVGDDTDKFADALRPYLDYVRTPPNGYVSVAARVGDGMELSVRTPG